MKTMHVGMVTVALSAAIPLAVTDCSDSSSTAGSDGGGHNSSGGSGGSSGAASSGSGDEADTGSGSGGSSGGGDGGSGASTPGDGGGGGNADGADGHGGGPTVTCQAPDGGAACDPGVVACGSTTCNTSQTSCCHVTGDAGSDTCVGPNGACAGTLLRCNETSDCADGLVCCDSYGATSCAASCGAYGYQICRSDSECGLHADAGAAKKCILQTCGGPAPGGGPPSPVVTLEACAVQSYTGMGAPSTWGAIYGCTPK